MEGINTKKSLWYYFILGLHTTFIVCWLTSPFWLPWPLIVFLSLILYLQSKYLGYCIMTRWQFGSSEVSFWVYYLGKLGIRIVKRDVTKWTMRFLGGSIVVGILWQTFVLRWYY